MVRYIIEDHTDGQKVNQALINMVNTAMRGAVTKMGPLADTVESMQATFNKIESGSSALKFTLTFSHSSGQLFEPTSCKQTWSVEFQLECQCDAAFIETRILQYTFLGNYNHLEQSISHLNWIREKFTKHPIGEAAIAHMSCETCGHTMFVGKSGLLECGNCRTSTKGIDFPLPEDRG